MKLLTDVPQYKKVIINHLDTGHGTAKKLESLGIRKNVQLKKISPLKSKGPVILSFLNSNCQIAIGHGIAKKIFVSEIS